jgi:selenium metabolism protein YedF
MKQIDVKGLACPQPVIKTKDALNEFTQKFAVITDSKISKDNIQKFLNANSVEFVVSEKEDTFIFEIEPVNEAATGEVNCVIDSEQKTLLFTSDTIGSDKELGKKLAKGFITTLPSADILPKNIFFINAGVKLTTTDDKEIIQALQELEKVGVQIYSCGLCLEYFELVNNLKVGSSGNALQTLQTVLSSHNTVTLG